MHREKLGDGGRKLVQLGHGLDLGKGDGAVGEEELDDAKVERIVLARARVDAALGRQVRERLDDVRVAILGGKAECRP